MLAVSPALGHAELVSSDPAAKAVLDTPPTTVTLTFSAGLDAAKSSFKVNGAGGTAATGKAAKDGATVMTADGLTLAPGTYTVEWTSVAEDGDIERGTFAFTVSEAPVTPSPSPTDVPSAAPPASAAPTASAAPSTGPSPVATPAASGDTGTPASSGSDVVLPIVAALVLLGVVGYVVLRRNRSA
jgi:copper resistance protein C